MERQRRPLIRIVMAYSEWREQQKLARLLDLWLPDDAFWTATDPVARSATAGAMRKARGVKAGISDCLTWYRGRTIAVELKSPYGQCRPAQRLVREQMLRAGIKAWWQCRTAESALWAIAKSGVKFRTLVNDDGSIERWQQPALEAWEIPKTDPRERRPRPPVYWAPKLAAEKVAAARGDDGADIAA
jgi:hypothetical protein